jgi:stearoyl-CoA desaturase (delta-9 desaturase)
VKVDAPRFEPNWKKVIPYLLIHVSAIVGVALVGFSWKGAALAAILFVVRVSGTTAGYHRYFSHRTFKTSRAMQLVIGLWANLSYMRGPLVWAAHHRYHHKHTDTPEDLHSPRQRGFWFAHTGWFLSREYDETRLLDVKDLQKFPELVWLDRHYYLASSLLNLTLLVTLGWWAFVWGGLVSTVLCWHAAFLINSGAHRFGTRPYPTDDDSRNHPVLALLLLGEGWHNNHHFYMHSARNGFRWWQIDVTYYMLWTLARVGLIWELRPPPPPGYETGSPVSKSTLQDPSA